LIFFFISNFIKRACNPSTHREYKRKHSTKSRTRKESTKVYQVRDIEKGGCKDPFKERFKKTRICESMPRHEAKMHFLLSSRWLPSSSMEVAPQNIAERKLAKNCHITA
jgi:hypothetical protein